MATLSAKLYMKNTSGTTQSAVIYSTTAESGTPYLAVNVNGTTQGYVHLGSTSNSLATSGRVKATNGTTYAICSSSTPAYSYKYITSSGSFTVPSYVTKLRVTCVGGGAGGFISNCGGSSKPSSWLSSSTSDTSGFAGGTTTFSSVSAKGGTAARNKVTTYTYRQSGEVIAESSNVTDISTISYGANNGSYYACSYDSYSGGAAVSLTDKNGTSRGTAGAGGYADGNPCSVYPGASGYKTTSTISVTPGQVISYTVGSGSSWSNYGSAQSSSWNSGGKGGAPGSAGAILVEWGSGIQ
jgi:hypothetical protein